MGCVYIHNAEIKSKKENIIQYLHHNYVVTDRANEVCQNRVFSDTFSLDSVLPEIQASFFSSKSRYSSYAQV